MTFFFVSPCLRGERFRSRMICAHLRHLRMRPLLFVLLWAAAGCAPAVTAPRPDGRLPKFIFWMENVPEFEDLGRAAAVEIKELFGRAGYRPVEIEAGRARKLAAERSLPPEVVSYPLGRALDADVIAFGRLTPVAGEEEPMVCLEFSLFDFRSGANLYQRNYERVSFLRGWPRLLRWGGRHGTKRVLSLLEKIRVKQGEPLDLKADEGEAKGLGDRAVVGVQMELADTRRKTGVMLTSVLPGSPAERAGVRPGDVILAVDDEPVRFPKDLSKQMSRRTAGDPVRLRVRRGAERIDFRIRTTGLAALYGSARRALEGKPAPDFPFTDAKGGRRKLSELSGSYVLVEFYSPLSSISLQGLVSTRWLHARWSAAGLRVISVALDDPALSTAIEKSGFIAWGRGRDPERALARRYRIAGLPARYLVGPDGVVVAVDLTAAAFDRLIRDKIGRAEP